MRGHAERRYISRYLGKRVAKDDSSVKVPAALSAAVKASIYVGLLVLMIGWDGRTEPAYCKLVQWRVGSLAIEPGWAYLPMINVIGIPWLLFLVGGRHSGLLKEIQSYQTEEAQKFRSIRLLGDMLGTTSQESRDRTFLQRLR